MKIALSGEGTDAVALILALTIPGLAAGFQAWGFLVDSVWVIPLVWLGVRRGKLAVILGGLLAILGVYLINGNLLFTVAKGILLLGVSSAFVIGVERGWKPGKMLFWACLAWSPFVLLNIAPLGKDWTIHLQQAILELFQQADIENELMAAQGIDSSLAKEQVEMVSRVTAAIYPAAIWVYGIITVVVNFLLIRFVFKRGLGLKLPIGPFTHWTLPWYAVWGAIIGIATYLIGDNWSLRWMFEVGINLGFVYVLVCMVLGTAITVYLLSSPKIPTLLKVVLVAISLIYPVIPALMGLLDLVLNFRKIPESV